MKIASTILCLWLAVTVNAQRLSVEVHAGTSNYQGDLRQKRYTFQDARTSFSFGAAYDLTDHITLRGLFTITSLQADDKNNSSPLLNERNLNFHTPIREFSVTGQYFLFPSSLARINPYAFVGLAVYHFNPYTYDTLGAKYFLQPLGTEGQGLSQYPDKKMYGLTQIAIPFGGGVRVLVNDNVNLGLEVGLRKLFTDYLDDVSTSYADRDVLLAARGAKAVELAYRTGELKNGNPLYPPAGVQRGSPDAKDWYYITSLTVNFRINGNGGNGRGSKTGCPIVVY